MARGPRNLDFWNSRGGAGRFLGVREKSWVKKANKTGGFEKKWKKVEKRG